MRTAIYARYSTTKQDGGTSIDHQINVCTEYAKFKAMEVVEVIQDKAQSGGDIDREGFHRLMDLIESGSIRALLVLEITRLSRDMLCLLTFERMCAEYGVSIFTADGRVSTDSVEDFLAFVMKAVFGEIERRTVQKRTRGAMQHLKANNKVYNHIPYGYSAQDGYLVENPSEQQIIILINQWYEDGNTTLAGIQRQLKSNGILSRGGNDWDHKMIRRLIGSYEPTRHKHTSEVGRACRAFIESVC